MAPEDTAQTETASAPPTGFAEEVLEYGNPPESRGEPESAEAVETSEATEAPKTDSDKPKAPEAKK